MYGFLETRLASDNTRTKICSSHFEGGKRTIVNNHKYTPTQLGVAGSLLPKTIRDAPHNREVNRNKF